MKTAKRTLKTKAAAYGEHYDKRKHFAAGAILHAAIDYGLRARAKFAPATLMLH